MSVKNHSESKPSISVDIESYSLDNINTLGVNINGKICNINTENAKKCVDNIYNITKINNPA